MGVTSDPNQTHNSFASMLRLAGVIGLLLLTVPIVRVLITGIASRHDPLVQVLVAMSAYTMIVAAFNVVLENAYFGVWLWVPLLILQAIVTSPDGGVTSRAR
jgi:hypothetical protein